MDNFLFVGVMSLSRHRTKAAVVALVLKPEA